MAATEVDNRRVENEDEEEPGTRFAGAGPRHEEDGLNRRRRRGPSTRPSASAALASGSAEAAPIMKPSGDQVHSWYTSVPAVVSLDLSLSDAPHRLYVLLRGRKSADGHVWPSLELLRLETGWSRAKVQRALAQLRERGLIERVTDPADDGQRSEYSIVDPSAVYACLDIWWTSARRTRKAWKRRTEIYRLIRVRAEQESKTVPALLTEIAGGRQISELRLERIK